MKYQARTLLRLLTTIEANSRRGRTHVSGLAVVAELGKHAARAAQIATATSRSGHHAAVLLHTLCIRRVTDSQLPTVLDTHLHAEMGRGSGLTLQSA